MIKAKELQTHEYHNFYSTYISKVPDNLDLIDGYKTGGHAIVQFFKAIPEDKLEYSYAKGKWSVKDVFQHIIDNERVFTYRFFRIARQDKTPLAGYEQNNFAASVNTKRKSINDLIEEYQAVRQYSLVLLKSLTINSLNFLGTVSGGPMSARAAAFVTLGHEIHHVNVLKERYL